MSDRTAKRMRTPSLPDGSRVARPERVPARLSGASRVAGGGRPVLRDHDEPMLAELVEAGWQDQRRASAERIRGGLAGTQLIGGERPLPGEKRPADREQWQRVLRENRKRRAGPRRNQVVGLAEVSVVAEDLRAFRNDLDVAEIPRTRESRSSIGLLAHRVDGEDQLTALGGPGRARDPARHRPIRGRGCGRHDPSVDQREGRQRVEQVEARDRGRLGDPREIGSGDWPLAGVRRSATAASAEAGGRWTGRSARRRSAGFAQRARSAPAWSGAGGIGKGRGNASWSGLSVFPGEWFGVAAGFRIGPEPAVTVLGRSRKQDRQPDSAKLSITTQLIHDLRRGSRPVDNSPDILAL